MSNLEEDNNSSIECHIDQFYIKNYSQACQIVSALNRISSDIANITNGGIAMRIPKEKLETVESVLGEFGLTINQISKGTTTRVMEQILLSKGLGTLGEGNTSTN